MSQAARLGGVCAPLILLLARSDWMALPFAVWAILAAAASAASLLLPETKGQPSLETLDELGALMQLPSPTKYSLGSVWRTALRQSDARHSPAGTVEMSAEW